LLRGVTWEEGEATTNWQLDNVNMRNTIASLGRQP